MKKNRIIFGISIIVLVFNLTACSSSNIKANDTQIKYENKELKDEKTSKEDIISIYSMNLIIVGSIPRAKG